MMPFLTWKAHFRFQISWKYIVPLTFNWFLLIFTNVPTWVMLYISSEFSFRIFFMVCLFFSQENEFQTMLDWYDSTKSFFFQQTLVIFFQQSRAWTASSNFQCLGFNIQVFYIHLFIHLLFFLFLIFVLFLGANNKQQSRCK